MRITHSDPTFTGSVSDIDFIDGTAELDSLTDEQRAALIEQGFIIDDESAPAPEVDEPTIEHGFYTDKNDALWQRSDAGWSQVGSDDILNPDAVEPFTLIGNAEAAAIIAGLPPVIEPLADWERELLAASEAPADPEDPPALIVGEKTDEDITPENAAVIEHDNGVVEVGAITEQPPAGETQAHVEPAAEVSRKRFGRRP